MGAGKVIAIIAALITIAGTYVFALWEDVGFVGSGIGYILHLQGLFTDANSLISYYGIEAWIYWMIVIVMIIFIVSGVLILLGIKSRIAGAIFSFFPVGVGIVFILMAFTTILGPASQLIKDAFNGIHYGNVFPFLVNLGNVALGTYLIIGGGVLGIISAFFPRD